MTEEQQIKKIQNGAAKIGVLFNPLSGRIRKRMEVIKYELIKIPGIMCREARNKAEFKKIINEFLEKDIDLFVVAAGDGTVQAILNILFTEYSRKNWPILAVIPGGTTNMTALDLVKYDDPENSAKKLCQYILSRTAPTLIKKHVLCIEQAGIDKVFGMFFAVGIIARAVIFSRSGIKQVGITGEIYSGLIMLGYFVGLIFRRCKGAWAPAKMKNVIVEEKNYDGTYQFLFASVLNRLLFNMRPYWGIEKKPMHITFVKQRRKKSMSTIFPLISGRGDTLKEDDGYHSYNGSKLELVIDDDYIVDGESYHAASKNGPLKITTVGPVTFLTW